MNELEFGERLKQLRKAKHLTQQELADRLGVSNKSVSRWESGSYPDIAMLGKLAKELGVTVDDLLGEAPPLRELNRSDWQNLLSFAFAIGGGVVFYLLDLFMPTALCYILYICMMAYGVYLQKNYTFHSQWFHMANLIMNLFVNFRIMYLLMVRLPGFYIDFSDVEDYGYFLRSLALGVRYDESSFYAFTASHGSYLLLLAAVALLTGGTQYLVLRYLSNEDAFHPAIGLRHCSVTRALPALCPLLLAGYFLLFRPDPAILPIWAYAHQEGIFYGLCVILAVLVFLWLWLRKERGLLFPVGMMLLFSTRFPSLCSCLRAFSKNSGQIYTDNVQDLNPDIYCRFDDFSWLLGCTAVLLVLLYLLCCCISLRREDGGRRS